MKKKIILGIHQYGRPLEIARLNALLYDDAIGVLRALLSYQNDDGGFGKGLEPDQQSPFSSPIQSWYAMLILKQTHFDPSMPMMARLFDYLLNTLDLETKRWPLYSKHAMDYPHAPWWTYKEDFQTQNPTAAILGFIARFCSKNHPLYHKIPVLLEEAFLHLNQTYMTMDMHELRCYIECLDDLRLSNYSYSNHDEMKKSVLTRLDHLLEKDPYQWKTSYGAKPSFFLTQQHSFILKDYRDWLIKEWTYTRQSLEKEGFWDPPFSWGNAEADRIWKATILYEHLYLGKLLNM